MRSHTTAGSQDTFGNCHTCQIFRRSLDTYHHHTLAGSMPFGSIIGKEYDLSRSGTRRSGKTTGQYLGLLQRCLVKYRVEQFVQLIGLTTHQCSLFVNHTLMEQVHGNLHHSGSGTLTVTGLEEPEFTLLYSELHILHITVVIFELRLQSIQFFIDFRHSLLHGRILAGTFFFAYTGQFSPTLRTDFCNLLRSTDTGNHVFALCINQILTVEKVFTGSSIAAEANTRSRALAHITEYHSLNAYGSTPFVRNSLHLTIQDGAFVHPGVEYGTNGTPQLLVGTSREVFSGLFFHRSLELLHEFLKVFHLKLVIQLHAFSMFHIFYNSLERVYIFLVHRLHTQHHVAIHLHETTVRVPCKACIARLTRQAFHHFVIQAKIQDSVHHARHGSACTRTNGNQQRILHITEFGTHQRLHMGNGLFNFILQQSNDFILPHFIIFRTNFCRYCKARRNRNPYKVHFCKVGTFPTQKVSHIGLSFCLAVTKGINSFFVHNINLKFLIVISLFCSQI